MFREMRRKKQLLPEAEALEILKSGKTGVLAVSGDGGYPYAVPLNYIYIDGKIYFHCAKSGHKLDAIKSCDKVSFTVIGEDEIYQEKYATNYRSVIVFGRASLMTDEAEMRRIVTAFAEKYCPDFLEGIPAEVDREFPALAMVEIEIEHLTGKEGLYLNKKRSNK